MSDTLLTDSETRRLIMALAAGSGQPVTEAECQQVVDWAEHVRIDEGCLRLVLCGELNLAIKDGQIAFIESKRDNPSPN